VIDGEYGAMEYRRERPAIAPNESVPGMSGMEVVVDTGLNRSAVPSHTRLYVSLSELGEV